MSQICFILIGILYGITASTIGVTVLTWQYWVVLVYICGAYLCGVTTD